MSSNAPHQHFAQVHFSRRLFRVPSLVRCTRGQREMAASWHKSGMNKIATSAVAEQPLQSVACEQWQSPKNIPKRFICGGNAIPARHSGWPADCSQVLVDVEKCLPSVARPLPFGEPARESIYRFSSSRRFYPCKAPIIL